MAAGISVKLSLDTSPFVRSAKSAMATGKALVAQFARNPIKFTAIGGFLAAEKGARMLAGGIGNIASASARMATTVAQIGIPLLGIGLIAGTAHAYNLGKEMEILSKRTGVSAGELVIWKTALEDADIDTDRFIMSIKMMDQKLTDAAKGGSGKAFEQIGLHVRDLINLKPIEAFKKVGAAIAGIENPIMRGGAAVENFGRNGAKMLSLFEKPGAFEMAADAVGKQAGILEKNSKVFEQISIRLGHVGLKLRGFFVGVAATIMPMIDKFSAIFDKADFSNFGKKIGEAINKGTAWLVAFWNHPQEVAGYFWEYAKIEALELGNVLIDVAYKFGEILKSAFADSVPDWMKKISSGAVTGAGLMIAQIKEDVFGQKGAVNKFAIERDDDLRGEGKPHKYGADHLDVAALRSKLVRPNAAFMEARAMLGQNAANAEKPLSKYASYAWRLGGIPGPIFAQRKMKGVSSPALDLLMKINAPFMGDTGAAYRGGMSLGSMHAGAYDKSPALSATEARRITRGYETEAQINARHALGSYHAGDAARIKKLQRDEAKNALKSNTEYLDDIAESSRRTADELTGKKGK